MNSPQRSVILPPLFHGKIEKGAYPWVDGLILVLHGVGHKVSAKLGCQLIPDQQEFLDFRARCGIDDRVDSFRNGGVACSR